MATVIMQKWNGFTPEQYDTLRQLAGWDRDVPDGMLRHHRDLRKRLHVFVFPTRALAVT